MSESKQKWWAPLGTLAMSLALALLLRATVAEARHIPSASMLPTLQIGDRVVVEKVSGYFSHPARGDILVFYPPHYPTPQNFVDHSLRWLSFSSQIPYIKRVIGLPGETIEVRQGQVWINQQPLAEPYIRELALADYPPTKIPPGTVFMMGDNRNNSSDSRIWGPVPFNNIVGHATTRIWPPNRVGWSSTR